MPVDFTKPPHLSRKAWIEGLRNPENKQGRMVLMDNTGAMCCLGLGLVLAGVPYDNEGTGDYYFGPERKWGMPSEGQMAILGISEPVAQALAACNDNGATFAQIADFLETGNIDVLANFAGEPRHMDALATYRP